MENKKLSKVNLTSVNIKDGIEILKQWLKEHDWDGFANPDLECGCGLDDLMPCESPPKGCFPAKGNWDNGFYICDK